jgi:hypothetical protein
MKAEDIYSDLLVADTYDQIVQSTGFHHIAFSSKGSLELSGPANLKKVRVDSFAKTPYFLKSPRSLASS